MALLEAYKGTEVFGFEFPYELPGRDEDGSYEVSEELECAGLECTEVRGLIAREYTLKLPDGDYYSDKIDHLPGLIFMKRRAMARLMITRCFKGYDINERCGVYTPLVAAAHYDEEEMLRACPQTRQRWNYSSPSCLLERACGAYEDLAGRGQS